MKHRCRKKQRIWILFFAVVVIMLVMIVVRIEKAVRPSAEMQSEQVVRNAANRIISETVSDYIAENDYTYSDFAAVIYDIDGRPVSVEALSGNINRVQSELAAAVNNNLTNNNTKAKIPVGSLSGSYLLAGRGFDINVRICPVGEAAVTLKSTFDSAGFNQTRHSVYAEISASLVSSTPLYSFETEQTFEFLIAETIIVGEVPEYAVKAWSG